MTDIDDLLKDIPVSPPSLTGAQGRKCSRHVWSFSTANYEVTVDPKAMKTSGELVSSTYVCHRCGKLRDEAAARRGKNARRYGNGAELLVARKYGGDKVGQAGGPVDVRGKDFNTQVKTHRRPVPGEWRKVFQNLEASTDRIPRLLLRFVGKTGAPPADFFVFPADAFLDWFGRDE